MKDKVLVVVGPTAVGKTALGIELAQSFDGEIISGDSQQVYRGLDIGTAKATAAEQAAAHHHLIDIRALDEAFSAADFVALANEKISELLRRGKTPIIVGGTGLYIQALIEGYHLGGSGQHAAMRRLRAELEQLSDEELFEQAGNIPEINRRRAIRAIEIAQFGENLENQKSSFDFQLIGLTAEREILYNRINTRVDLMMTAGLEGEARLLFEQNPEVQAAKGIGYKEFFPYFKGEISLDEAVELVKRNSRRYAKRQLTWFRNRMNIEFHDVFAEDYPENVLSEVERFLL